MLEFEVVYMLIACASLIPCAVDGYSNVVDIFNVTSRTWATAALSTARSSLAASSLPNFGVAIFAGGDNSTFCFKNFVASHVTCFVGGMFEFGKCSVQILS
jgi:hypothetical protein